MFITEWTLASVFVGVPLLSLVALLLIYRSNRRMRAEISTMLAVWNQIDWHIDRVRKIEQNVKRVTDGLDDLVDNHEQLHATFKKFRSRVTMQERRRAQDTPSGVHQAEGETPDEWKARMRLQMATRRNLKE